MIYSHQAARILSELPEYQEETRKAKQLQSRFLFEDQGMKILRIEIAAFEKWRQKVLTFIQAIS